jgi:hypothetical protein
VRELITFFDEIWNGIEPESVDSHVVQPEPGDFLRFVANRFVS